MIIFRHVLRDGLTAPSAPDVTGRQAQSSRPQGGLQGPAYSEVEARPAVIEPLRGDRVNLPFAQ